MTITSKEVAEMLGKRHDNLLRAIRKYITQLGDEAPKYFSEDERGTDTDFMVARNEHDEYMTGRIIGVDECWQDGDLNTCVAGLLRGIATIAHSRY